MTSTVFSSGTVITAPWLNDVNTSTYTTVPSNTAAIAALNGTTGAANVGYTPAGTGAVATTVQAKLRQTVSVIDFGADPTGAADSKTAFQATIDYLVSTGKSGVVVVPAGSYKLLSGITIDASVCTIRGDAALLDFSSFGASTGAAITLTGDAIDYGGNPYFNGVNVMQGLKIKGPGPTVTGNTGVLLTGSGLEGSNDYALRDCEVFSFANGVVMGNVAYHLLFDHCSVFLCGVAVTGQSFTNAGARNVFHRCTIYNSDYGFVLQNAASGSTDITDCVLAGIGLVVIFIDGGHLCVTNCDIEPGGSQPANYRTLWVTNNAPGSYSYVNWHGNQVSVKNATNVPIFGIDGAAILTITGGYLYANPSSTGGVFGSTGTGTGEIAAFNWSSDYGSNLIEKFNSATVSTYLHQAFTNSISASATSMVVGTTSAATIIARDGVFFNGTKTVTLTTLSTPVSLGVAASRGLLVMTDGTLGGSAVFMCDSGSGVCASIQNSITGLAVSYVGGTVLSVQVTSGAVPRSIRWSLIKTAA